MKPLHLLIASLRPSRPIKARNSRQRRLRFDQLEDRRMLAAGVFDQSFGTEGFIEAPNTIFEAKIQVVDGEQKIIRLDNGGSLTRYDEDGAIDDTFNTAFNANFVNLPSLRAPGTPFLSAPSVKFAVQGDKLLVAGELRVQPNNEPIYQVGVVRYQSNGTLDDSFGIGGVLKTGISLNGTIGPSFNLFPALEIETQGDKVLVAMSGGPLDPFESSVVVARYTSNGAVDTTFANQGQLVYHTPGMADWVTGMRVDNDAAVVSVMTFDPYAGQEYPSSLIRIAGDQLDNGFGANGVLQISPRSNWAMQDDRTLVETSIVHQNDPDDESDDEYVQTLEMYDSAGDLDADFKATSIDFGPWGMAFQPDGGIVLVKNDSVLRLLPNGEVDSSFGSNGVVDVNIDLSQLDYPYPHPNKGFTLQPDGKIVLVDVLQGPELVSSMARLVDNDDGIDNAVDTLPLVTSEAFSDGTTSGQIIDRGDQFLTIIDAPNPARGVRISANPAGGSAPAEINVQGIAFFLDPGDSVTVTRGSVILSVVAGTIDVNFAANGQPTVATASLSAGAELTFEPETVTFTAAETNVDPVEVVLFGENGQQATATFSSGDEIKFDPETFDVVAPATNESPVSIVVATGEVITALPGDTVHAAVTAVTINFAPESLNLDSNGLLTVFIYGAADFSASQIDVSTVRFAGATATHSSLLDANGDGQLDLQLKFRRQDTALLQLYQELLIADHDADGVLDSARQVATLSVTGQTLDDHHFTGFDNLDLFLAGKALRTLLDQLASSGAI